MKMSQEEIDTIINKMVPLIAEENDHEFFRGVLQCVAQSCPNSSSFAYVITQILMGGNTKVGYLPNVLDKTTEVVFIRRADLDDLIYDFWEAVGLSGNNIFPESEIVFKG